MQTGTASTSTTHLVEGHSRHRSLDSPLATHACRLPPVDRRLCRRRELLDLHIKG